MKRFLSMITAAALVAGSVLTGCGNTQDTDTAADTAAERIVFTDGDSDSDTEEVSELESEIESKLSVQLMPVNEYTRPGDSLSEVNDIVVHYVANPGTTAQENADYFASLAESGETSASCHFIIGLEGEIIQLVPLDEISYCSNERNDDTIAIECCHPDETGVYTDETYESLVQLCAWLLEEYDLTYENIIRHYDITGKLCPIAFVEDPDYWYGFKADVASGMGLDITAEEIAANSDDTFETGDTSADEETYEEEPNVQDEKPPFEEKDPGDPTVEAGEDPGIPAAEEAGEDPGAPAAEEAGEDPGAPAGNEEAGEETPPSGETGGSQHQAAGGPQ